jgi:hypothetical protein
VADDERDHEDYDAYEQGGSAAHQNFVVFAADDEASLDVVGEDGRRGQKSGAGGGQHRRQSGCQDLWVALSVSNLLQK